MICTRLPSRNRPDPGEVNIWAPRSVRMLLSVFVLVGMA
jgi:hypothetical protein